MAIDKQFMIMRGRQGRRVEWEYYDMKASLQQADHEIKRLLERDGGAHRFAIFEMVKAYGAEVKIVEMEVVAQAAPPVAQADLENLIAVPGQPPHLEELDDI